MRRDDEISPASATSPDIEPAALLRAGASLHGFWREAGIEGAELSALEKILAAGPQGFRRHLERPQRGRMPVPPQPAAHGTGRPAIPPRAAPAAAPAPRSGNGSAANGSGGSNSAGNSAVQGPLARALAEAEMRARSASDRDALDVEMRRFDLCPLKRTAARTVTFEGPPHPKVMLIGGAPSREDDDHGRPWSGTAGALLDTMFAAIGLDRKTEMLCGYSIFWRPPGDRDPVASEVSLCAPFVRRAIALAKPAVIVLAGSFAAQSMLQRSETIARLRGKKFALSLAAATSGGPDPGVGNTASPEPGIPVLVMLEPKHLLLRPQDKARAWEDLLLLRRELDRPR